MPGTRVAAWMAERLERHRHFVLFAFSAALFYSVAVRASAKPFWHDEIYTLLLADLPSLPVMWAAIHDGMDLAPPLTALMTRAVRAFAGPGPVAMRLVPLLGFWLMTVVLFEIVRRRANGIAALTAALIPLFTAGYRHAYEARAYGLMMGLFALSLFAWSEAAAGRRRRWYLPLLTTSLAAGLWNHYFAVLAYVPIAGGELVRLARTRRLDLPMVAALAGSAILASPLLGLVESAGRQRGTFWAPASIDQVAEVYWYLLEPLPWTLIGAASALIAVLALAGRVLNAPVRDLRPHPPAHEIVAGVLAFLVPLAGVVIGVLFTGVLVPRYLLTGVVGITLVTSMAVSRLARRAGAIELVLPIVLIAAFIPMLGPVVRLPHPVDSRPLLLDSLRSAGRTAVTGGLTCLQLWYYAPPELKARLVYVASPEQSLHYLGTDTIDLGYLALARWTPVTVVPIEALQAHHELRVYAYGSGWLLQALEDRGARMEAIGAESGARLYRAIFP